MGAKALEGRPTSITVDFPEPPNVFDRLGTNGGLVVIVVACTELKTTEGGELIERNMFRSRVVGDTVGRIACLLRHFTPSLPPLPLLLVLMAGDAIGAALFSRNGERRGVRAKSTVGECNGSESDLMPMGSTLTPEDQLDDLDETTD